MTWSHVHSEEAENVGEPEDATAQELHGEAPPCTDCGERPRVDGRGLCSECLDEVE
jgi:hypothetical protein